MPKKAKGPKGKKLTLKIVKNSIRITPDGKRRLSLPKMGIAVLPKCLLKLSDVEELDLSRNLIRKVPDWIVKFKNLRLLDLHSNQIEKLPGSIGGLQNLHHLNVCNNKLTANGVPTELSQLENLHKLNLGLNAIEVLPTTLSALKKLQELGLFDNRLTTVPSGILTLPKLKKLNVKRNPLSTPIEGPAEEPRDTIQRVPDLYLVTDGGLCAQCAANCQAERLKVKKQRVVATGLAKPSGLVTPNSIAKEIYESDE